MTVDVKAEWLAWLWTLFCIGFSALVVVVELSFFVETYSLTIGMVGSVMGIFILNEMYGWVRVV